MGEAQEPQMPEYVPSEEAKAAAREAKTRALTAYTMERIDQGPGEGNYDRILDLTISDMLTAAVPIELQRERERWREQLAPLLHVLDGATLEDAPIPDDWPSVRCQNIGHEQRPEGDWRCPDCYSTWWAINGDETPDSYHAEAYVFGLLVVAALPTEEERDADH